jgi:IPT/TIG domain
MVRPSLLLASSWALALAVLGAAAASAGARPVIKGLEPHGGPATGGTEVVLFGKPLQNAKAVYFGGVPGTMLREECNGDCEITPYTVLYVVSPPHKPGTVKVTFENAAGERSAPTAAAKFTYTRGDSDGEPLIESLSTPSITETSAELEAQINPHGKATHYTFWARHEGEGAEPELVAQGKLAASNQPTTLREQLTGLHPGCDYGWWVEAKNWYGVEGGEFIRAFTDTPGTKGPSCRR